MRMIVKMSTFGDNLAAAMQLRGVTKQELAERVSRKSATSVDKWLDPSANPTLDTLFDLAKALDVSIEHLCRGIDEEYDLMRLRVAPQTRLLDLWEKLEALGHGDALLTFLETFPRNRIR